MKMTCCADLVGGSGEAAFAWDRLVGEALNPAPITRSYSCSDGHLLAAPEPEHSASTAGQLQPPEAEQPGQHQGGDAATHSGRSASAGANSQRDAAADQAVRESDAVDPGRGNAQDGPKPTARPAPPEAFVQVIKRAPKVRYRSCYEGVTPSTRSTSNCQCPHKLSCDRAALRLFAHI
jgi:hypothetical protein